MNTMRTGKDQENSKEVHQVIDFKMVTFSLGGKDYGIDIMKVKEISKVEKYTYVPNTFPYVLGVHNLRGEIISIIDMRKMFSLSMEDKQDVLNVIIIRLDDFQLGIVVDSINKVIGISSDNIQPPPALFSDINIKYLSGVVEYGEKLFLILDVEKIFLFDEKVSYNDHTKQIPGKSSNNKDIEQAVHEFNFIVETLATFKKFYVTELNRQWVELRFKEWRALKNSQGEDFQLKNEADADAFLINYYSSDTGRLLSQPIKLKLDALLPEKLSGTINVWNTGCSRGHEAYSLAVILRLKYPKEILKVWANDNDLLSVSTAPNLFFKEIEIPDYIKNSNFLEKGPNGFFFTNEIKDLIYFEFHDTLHTSAMPDIDLIMARDVLSFQAPANQKKMLDEFDDKLKAGGLLILGENENIVEPGWEKIEVEGLNVYRKRK